MTNAELAEQLNREFGLSGPASVTGNVIRQWVLWGLLPKAKVAGRLGQQGPNWSRDDEALRRARRLAALRLAGMVREDALVAQAYFEWDHDDIDRVRDAILREYQRGRAQMLKRLTSDTGFSDFANLSAVRKSALRRQGGPLDKRFKGPPIEQSTEFYVTFLDWVRTGGRSQSEMMALVLQALSDLSPALAGQAQLEGLQFCIGALKGLFGSPDEIGEAAELSLISATGDDMTMARKTLRRIFRLIRQFKIVGRYLQLTPDVKSMLLVIEDIRPQIISGKWAVAAFVGLLHAARPNAGPVHYEMLG